MTLKAVAALAACAMTLALVACTDGDDYSYNGRVIESWDQPLVLEGTNWDGEAFTLDQLNDRVVVVFFGYTYCPDVCPFTLAKLKRITKLLGEDSDRLEVVFASVDPHRDTIEKLARYVPNFDRRFYGVHLTATQIEQAMTAFGGTVRYGTPRDGAGTDSFYYVDHVGTYFVLDGAGQLRLTFPPDVTVEEMMPDLEHLLSGLGAET